MKKRPELLESGDPALIARLAKAMAQDQENKRAEAEAQARMIRIEEKLDQVLAILTKAP